MTDDPTINGFLLAARENEAAALILLLPTLHAGLHEVFWSRRFMRRSFEPASVGHKLSTVAPLFLEQARMIFFNTGSAFRTDGKRLALSQCFREERQRKKKSRCSNHKLASQC
jgi:hypothetical protein